MKLEKKHEMEMSRQKLHSEKEFRIPENPVNFLEFTLGYPITSYQRDLVKKFVENQFITARWCRQSGKTHTLAGLLLWYAFAFQDVNIAVVGPSWRQTKLVIRNINGFLAKLPREYYGKPQRTIVELTNGSRIECFPNNPDTIRGPSLDVIYCDEMNFIANDEEMFDAIMWTLVTKKHGKFVCSSTPWSTHSIFWRIWNEDAFKEFVKSHVTWREAVEPNGPLSLKMVQKLKQQYEGDQWRWNREMEADWAEDTNKWLTQALICKSINENLELIQLDTDLRGRFYVGVDLGKHRDFSVVAVVEMREKGYYVVHCTNEKTFPLETPYASVIGYVKKLTSKWQISAGVFVDMTGVGDPIVADMRASGIPNVEGIVFTEQRKEEIATILKQTMIDGRLQLPYDRDLINELNVEEFELTKSGKIAFNHHSGTHDDKFWAIALAVYAAVKRPLSLGMIDFGKIGEKEVVWKKER
jgi:phage FluMu gp28-like protein